MIIDAHAHMISTEYLNKLSNQGGKWAKEAARQRLFGGNISKPYANNVGPRIEQLDKYGIDFQVVTPFHALDSNLMPGNANSRMAYAKVLNDGMAKLMEESKGRLIAAGSIPMEYFDQSGQQELERAINKLGLKGIAIITNIHGKPLDAPEFEPFWAEVSRMDIPVWLHPRDPAGTTDRSYEAGYDLMHQFGWPFETTLALSRLVFSGIMERYPNLKVIAHHLGGGLIPFYMGRILETYAPESENPVNMGSKRSPLLPKSLFDYFSRFYYDTAVGGVWGKSAPAIRCAYELLGANQLVFATDYPAGPGEARLAKYPRLIESLGFPEKDEKKIFANNARQILHLS